MLSRYSLLLFLQSVAVVISARCSFENPKPGEIHPVLELEVITRQTYPQNNGTQVTLQCKATAPVVNPQLYNPVLLNPAVISFFFNGERIPVNNCPPSSRSSQKICELQIPSFGPEHAGKYYCMARNTYRCTTMGADIPANPCPAPGEKEEQALNSFQSNLIKMVKCLKDYTICCIKGSNCNTDYQKCLQNA